MTDKEHDEIINEYIMLENNLAVLYSYYAEIFPEDFAFFKRLADDERSHARYIKDHADELPNELLKISLGALQNVNKDVREILVKHRLSPPDVLTALHAAFLIENTTGEAHFQSLHEKEAWDEKLKMFQFLNAADKDHAQKINAYIIKKKPL